MSKPDDLFIVVLKYGKEHLHEWITGDDVRQHLKERGFDLQDELIKILVKDALGQIFVYHKKKEEVLKYRMHIDRYFQLLEYEELHDARNTAAEAKKQARTALWVTFTAMTFSIILSTLQLRTPLSIEGSQFARIDAIGSELEMVNSTLRTHVRKAEAQSDSLIDTAKPEGLPRD